MLIAAPPSVGTQFVPASAPYVLVVDDHEPSLRRLDELIKLSGHSCVPARSGTEALLCCDRSRPRIVVTDLTMPNLDGRGLALWLQARHPSVPIILMTGQSFDARTLGELHRIFTAVLAKPVDIQLLVGLLDRLMPPRSKRERDSSRS
jgi:DNA-binding NtrC family response regulator